jgi:phage tail protein X
VPVAVPRGKSSPIGDASGAATYAARAGDTVSQLAVALLGRDTQANRDAVIAANPTLQSNPDRVLAGQTYSADSSLDALDDQAQDRQERVASAVSVATASPKEDAPAAEPTAESETAGNTGAVDGPSLQYTAQPGDTVRGLAADLLGGDTKANRKGIVAENASLQQNPDHLVAGKSYTIVARNGLSADPDAPQAMVPTTQPDADDAARMSIGRMLGYTAKPGDTVSKLAVILLGSDTRANRDLIVRSNFTLKQKPDHLVAGVTYWIPAPIAESRP